ncbi:MAG: mechanosensitive ion channel family protein [Parafannyhessea sp.]|uniref:mechanosensitive ion channel family protein n=1 Tax=Parafannyhessea sp. TaxID=2847324 RepID=UPI003F052BC8
MDWNDLLGRVVYLAVAVAVTALVDRGVTRVTRRVLDASSIPSASIFVNIIRGVIWAFGLLSVLEPVFGIKATAFVAALGVTSVVLSFGLQDTVSNVFSGLGLMLGKVVQPGDYVEVAGFEGFVTDVNWRHTTVQDRLGNQQIIPNSVLNKTAFTRKSASTAGSCGVDFLVRPDADLAAVTAEVVRDATAALAGVADPAYEVSVSFTGMDAYGTHGTVWMHVKDDATFSAAQDRVARVLQGRPWLADSQVAGEKDGPAR